MVTTMAFLQYYLKSSTKRGWEMSSLLVAIQPNEAISLSINSIIENLIHEFLSYFSYPILPNIFF